MRCCRMRHSGSTAADTEALLQRIVQDMSATSLGIEKTPGVCTVDRDFAALAKRIHATLEDAGSRAGRLLRINRLP